MRNLIFILLFIFPNILFSQSEGKVADSLYYLGKKLYYDGDYKKAKTILEEALEKRIQVYGENSEEAAKAYLRLGKTERRLRQHNNSLTNLKIGLTSAKKAKGNQSELVGDFYLELSNLMRQMYDPEGMNEYNKKTIKVYRKVFGKESSEVGNVYMNFGLGMTKMGQYKDAEKYFQKTLDIFNKSSAPNSKDFNRIYSNLGNLYRKKGDFDKSIEYGRKALEIKLLNYKPTHPSVPKYYSNIGKAYAGKGAFDEGLPYILKTVELQEKSVGKDHPETGGAYGELGSFYADMGESKKALVFYEKALKIMEARLSLTHPYVVNGYNNIGSVYEDMKSYDQALRFYQMAIEKYQNHSYVPIEFIPRTYRRMGRVYIAKEAPDQALDQIGLAMEYLARGFRYKKGKDQRNPSLKKIQAEVDFLDLLETKSEALELLYLQNKKNTDLKNVLKTLELAVELIEKMRRGFLSESSRQDLSERVSPIFKAAVRVAYQMYELTDDTRYLQKALNFSEKSKASILWENMNTRFALEHSGIPQSELDELETLQEEIQAINEQLFKATADDNETLTNKLFDLKLAYEEQIIDLEQYNPNYFALKHATPNLDIDALSTKIPNDQTVLIEYFYDKKNIYTFILSSDGLQSFRQPFSKKVNTSIQALREFDIQQYTNTKDQGNENYIAHLNLLYDILVRPISSFLQEKNQMIIVPHGILNYLPFEMLTPATKEKDFRQLPYLVKNFQIQYIWSLAFYQKENTSKTNFKRDFAGFAPSFERSQFAQLNELVSSNTRSSLSELNYTQTEIERAQHHFNGDIFIGTTASEPTFQQYASDSKIIHLATHAYANDRVPMQSGLIFSTATDTIEDGYLNAYEIYNMSIPADLAVMSACNTGFGQLAEGEGVISLGRAFSYAGCKSVLMSLWMANDQSTAGLMDYFYQNLAQGYRKDEALRSAKLAYLEQADPLTAHPYFWAGMVAVGDMTPLSKTNRFGLWWIILSSVFAVFILLFKNRKK